MKLQTKSTSNFGAIMLLSAVLSVAGVIAACDDNAKKAKLKGASEDVYYDAEGKPIVKCNDKWIRLNENHGPCLAGADAKADKASGSRKGVVTTTTTTLAGVVTTTTTTMPGATTTTTMANSNTRGLLLRDPANANVWVFTLPQNVGRGPWNSAETVLQIRQGETLRVRNVNTTLSAEVNPTLHTNNFPCPHGGTRRLTAAGGTFRNVDGIPIGGWLECDIPLTATPGGIATTGQPNRQVYDHGGGGAVFIEILEILPRLPGQ